jgi:predicted transcriptional regulator
VTTTTEQPREQPKVATFKMNAGDYEQLEEIARREDRTLSWVLRQAVRTYLSHEGEAA